MILHAYSIPKEWKDLSETNNFRKETFYNCNALTSIKLPEGLKEIEAYTFYYCTSLTDITIPESIEFISNAFISPALTTVTCLAVTPPELFYGEFQSVNVIYVPAGSVEAYKTSSS